ncbi:MAG TPA: hypothetical protein VF945_04730 [Polyangia bacterium]
MSVVVASLMFASLLSPPVLLVLLLAWLCGAHALLALPLIVWLVATVWLSANAGVRHHWRRQRFLDALTDAPLDVLDQVARVVGLRRRRGLRAI